MAVVSCPECGCDVDAENLSELITCSGCYHQFFHVSDEHKKQVVKDDASPKPKSLLWRALNRKCKLGTKWNGTYKRGWFTCHQCGHDLGKNVLFDGSPVRCPNCGTSWLLPYERAGEEPREIDVGYVVLVWSLLWVLPVMLVGFRFSLTYWVMWWIALMPPAGFVAVTLKPADSKKSN